VIAFLLAALLCAPAAALDADAPGRPALRARDAIEALPVEDRVELRKMFFRYRDEVARRLDQGWEYGILNDAVIEDVDEPFQPARLLEDAEKHRVAELERLKAGLDATKDDANAHGLLMQKINGKNDELDRLRRKLRREKGICRDWSDDVWYALTTMNLDDWTVDDRRRTARPYHTAAVACAPADQPTVCLAFDPWAEGKPLIYAYSAWDDKDPGGRIPNDYFIHGLPEKVP
jgi:hypothetical protein